MRPKKKKKRKLLGHPPENNNLVQNAYGISSATEVPLVNFKTKQ